MSSFVKLLMFPRKHSIPSVLSEGRTRVFMLLIYMIRFKNTDIKGHTRDSYLSSLYTLRASSIEALKYEPL